MSNNNGPAADFKKWFHKKGYMVVIALLFLVGLWLKDYLAVHTQPTVTEQKSEEGNHYISNKLYLQKSSSLSGTYHTIGDDVYIQLVGNKDGAPTTAFYVTATYDIAEGKGKIDTLRHVSWKYDFEWTSRAKKPQRDYYRIIVEDSKIPQLTFYTATGDTIALKTTDYAIHGFYGYLSRYLNSNITYTFVIPISRKKLAELSKLDITSFSITPTFTGTKAKRKQAIEDKNLWRKLDECYQMIAEKQTSNNLAKNNEQELLIVLSDPSNINLNHASRLVTVTPFFITKDIQLCMSGILYDDNTPEYRFYLKREFMDYGVKTNTDLYIAYYPDSAAKKDRKELKFRSLPHIGRTKLMATREKEYSYQSLHAFYTISAETMQLLLKSHIVSIGYGLGNGSEMQEVTDDANKLLNKSFRTINGYLYNDAPYTIINYGVLDINRDLIQELGLIKKSY